MIQTTHKKYKLNNKLIMIIIFLFIICVLSIFSYKNNFDIFNINKLSNLSKDNADIKPSFKMTFASNENPEIMTYNQKILYVTGKKIKIIDMENKVEYEIVHELNNSSISCDDKNIFIYEKNGKKLVVYENDKLVLKKDIVGVINNAKFLSGHILLNVIENDINKILLYDIKGNLILSKDYLEDEYIVDFDFSNELNKVTVLSLMTRSDMISSKIDYFDIKGIYTQNSIPTVSTIKHNLLASNIKIYGNNNVILAADNGIISLDDLGNEKWNRDFSNIKLHSINISSGKYIVLETSTVKNFVINKREVITLDSSGKEIGDSIDIKMPIKDIVVNENFFLVNDTKNIYSVSNGMLIFSYPIKNIDYIKAIDQKILLVSKDSLEVIDIN